MNQEQTIDDILKLLKESVNDDEFKEKPREAETASSAQLSNDELKKLLNQTYATARAPKDSEKEPYALDYDFLDQVQSEEEAEETLREQEESDEMPWRDDDRLLPATELFDAVDESVTVLPEAICSDEVCGVEVPTVKAEDATGDHVATVQTCVATADEEPVMETTETLDERETLEEAENSEEAEFILKEATETTLEEDAEIPVDEFPTIETVALNDVLLDYEPEEALNVSTLSLEDSEAYLSVSALEQENPNYDLDTDQIHESVFDLMLQFGCEEEWATVSEDDLSSEFMNSEEDSLPNTQEEFCRYEQTETVYQAYRLKKRETLWRMLAMALMSIAVFFYDTLPLFGVDFSGIFDYSAYPGAYMMMGFQLLLVCALLLGKPLWKGFLKLFSSRPNLYSVVALILMCVLAYDITMLSVSHWPCVSFHFLTSLMTLSVLVGEYALLIREMKVFSVYSTEFENAQYTLLKSEGDHSLAEQMYRSGLERRVTVHAPESVRFPKGFFASMREDVINNRMIAWTLLPTFGIGVAVMLVAILFKQSMEQAAMAAMMLLFTMLPLHAVSAICIPLCVSASHLQKRGIGITGKSSMDEYTESGLLVYKDLHLFRKCEPKDVGMVIYEKDKTELLLGGLASLYEAIGGPMSEIFVDVPKECCSNLRIRRIFRNGIEAFLDRKHILLVGDAAFMQRYGLTFPAEENPRRGRNTLCVSLNGKISAKLSVRYRTEPIFEMLTERLAKERVQVVIETFDPLIQAEVVASARQLGKTPISVFHKSVSQFYRRKMPDPRDKETGILATGSRLKLIEGLVWCKRLLAIRKWNDRITAILSGIGFFATVGALSLGLIDSVNQYWLLIFAGLGHLAVFWLSYAQMPKRNYFTVEAYHAEIESLQTSKTKMKKEKEHE